MFLTKRGEEMKDIRAKVEIRTGNIFVKAEGDQEWLSSIVDQTIALKLKCEKVEYGKPIIPNVKVSNKWLDA